jgi:nitronate monooxygenase
MSSDTIKRLLGTKLPIIQAPMAGVQDSALTIAVCQAGGLGSLPCGMLNTDNLVSEIRRIKAATNAPYNLNFMCHDMPAYDEKKHSKWQAQLAPYFNELDTEYDNRAKSPSRLPFNHAVADAIEPFSPEFISFHYGLPDPDLLARIKQWGTTIVSSATTVDEAIWLEERGADGIIAQGIEAGGHRGMFLSDDINTQTRMSVLVAQLANKVNLPIIAAGGIGNNRDVKAALLLGADGVQIGTAYLLCTEAKTSQLHRLAIKSDRSQHTALTTIFSGKPARGIVNRAMKELGNVNPLVPAFPYASIEMTQLRSHAEKRNSDDFSPLWSGENTSGCKEISASELTTQLAAGC